MKMDTDVNISEHWWICTVSSAGAAAVLCLYCVHLWSSGTELLSWWRRSSDSDQTCRPTAPPPRPSRPSQNPEDSETRHMRENQSVTVTPLLPPFLPSSSLRAVCCHPLLTGCSPSSSHSAWDFQICLTFASSEQHIFCFIYETHTFSHWHFFAT